MTNSSNTVTKAKADPMAAVMDSVTALNPMQGGAMKTALAMGSETLQFFAARMQQDVATQQAILTCKTMEDLQKVQADFYKTAMEDYRCATERMMSILLAGAPAATASTKRGYDDVPL